MFSYICSGCAVELAPHLIDLDDYTIGNGGDSEFVRRAWAAGDYPDRHAFTFPFPLTDRSNA